MRGAPEHATTAPIGRYAPDPHAHLLEVDDLHVEFRTSAGTVHAVNGLGFRLEAGQTLALLGESGSGKTVSAHAMLGVLDSPPGFVTGGSVRYRGVDLMRLSKKERAAIRGQRIGLVFQDALSALNPVFTVGWQVGEMVRRHRGASRREARTHAIELMERVRIPNARERFHAYPHELSGGMRQRIMIAIALALDPDVLIADEPTTALDVTVQAQLMGLFSELQRDTGMGLILITHDLGVVAEVADRVTVMYAGKVVEEGPIERIYDAPAHPYTLGLLQSVPRADKKAGPLSPIGGAPPDMRRLPPGCTFHPRCPYMKPLCIEEEPPLTAAEPAQLSACHFKHEVRRDAEGRR